MRRSSIVGLSLFVAACGPRTEDTGSGGRGDDSGGPQCAVDDDCGWGSICEDAACEEGDRDNALEDAQALLWADTTDGEINPVEDVDWYAVEADGGEFVRIAVVTAEDPDGIDSVVSVYTAAGKRLVWEDEHPAGNVSSADSMCFAYFPDAGTYYIKVEDDGTFYDTDAVGGSGESYTVEITEWNSVVQEPDSAQDVGLDYGVSSANVLYSFPVLLEAAGDVDYATLDLPAVGSPLYLVALQHADESDLTPRVTVYNRDGDLVLDHVDPTQEDAALLPNPLGTSYVIGVTDDRSGGGDDYWGWLFFVIREAGSGNPAETEANDTVETAEVLALEDQDPDSGRWWAAYHQGRIDTAEDADVYAFEVPFDDAYVTVYVGAAQYGSLLVPRLEVLDAAGETLDLTDSSAGTDEDAIDLGPYAAGSYYLRVSATPESAADGGEGFFYLFGLHATSFLVGD